MLLIFLKDLIKKYTEIENYETSVQSMQAVTRNKSSDYAYETDQSDMEADQMEVLAHACESKLGADSSAYSGPQNHTWK